MNEKIGNSKTILKAKLSKKGGTTCRIMAKNSQF